MRGKRMVDWAVLPLLLVMVQQQRPAFSFSSPCTALREGGQQQHTAINRAIPLPGNTDELASAAGRGRGIRALSAQTIDAAGKPRQREQQQQQQQQEGGFQWARQWYPVAVMRDLEARDPRQPYPVQLLGEALVVWKDPKDAGWKAFADRCPHRWAPLSEGRVDQRSGNLQCIYHGWEFQGDGKCSSIPQATADTRENAQDSKRACATVIPTRIEEEKLWLWPDSSLEGVKESERVKPVTVPGLDFEDFGGNWYARDLCYGADTLIENLVDPAHVPFAHHGVIGTRALGTPMAMEIDGEVGSGEDEFVTNKIGYAGRENLRVGFRAPGLVYYESDYTEVLPTVVKRLSPPLRAVFWALKMLNIDKRISMKDEDREEKSDRLLSYFVGYAVPTSPGKCRILTRTARNFFLQHPVIPRRFRNSLSKEHLSQHSVLDGDSMALHMQERSLAGVGERGAQRPEKIFYMPTATDAGVRFFRKWYHSRGGGGPAWAEGVDPSDLGPVLPREEVLGRMGAHTKDCSACGKAFRVSDKLKRLSAWCTLLLLAAAAAAPRGLLPLKLAVGALASAGLAVAMSKRQQKFVFVDYVHAERDG